MRGLGGSRVMPGLQNPRAPRVVVERGQGAAGRSVGRQIAGLVLLKGARAAADQLAGPGPAQPGFSRMRLIASCSRRTAGQCKGVARTPRGRRRFPATPGPGHRFEGDLI